MSEPIAALLVEDDMRLAKFTAEYLAEHEVSVTHVADGVSALNEALLRRYDVVILDLMLPTRDGLSVCRALRERSDIPIIMVTALVEEADRIIGFDAGSDDYLTKPFSPRELLARVRAAVRRYRGELGPASKEVNVGPLHLHLGGRRATLLGKALLLTTAEFDLLWVFANRPGRVLSREQLLELVKGSAEHVFDRAIDVQISRLRHKLADQTGGDSLIRTVRGAGYMLAEPD